MYVQVMNRNRVVHPQSSPLISQSVLEIILLCNYLCEPKSLLPESLDFVSFNFEACKFSLGRSSCNCHEKYVLSL